MTFESVIPFTEKQRRQVETLELSTSEDILQHFPFRYFEIQITNLNQAKLHENVSFTGKVVSDIQTAYYGKKTKSTFKIMVDDEIFFAVIFNRPWLKQLVGKTLTFFGIKQETNILIQNYNQRALIEQVGISSVYRLNKNVTNLQFQNIVTKTLSNTSFTEVLPTKIITKYKFEDSDFAYHNIHFPTSYYNLSESIKRLKYQQLFMFNIKMIYLKRRYKIEKKAKIIDRDRINQFIAHIPFTLNDDQLNAVQEILDDIQGATTMYRLLEGDVGSGKTIVAFIVMYAVATANQQAVLLSPTDLLAKQHYQNAIKLFEPNQVVYLSSRLSKTEADCALDRILCGKALIVIGTHRLFQDDVIFFDLGLVITDEQQRFGVSQRQALINKGQYADVLQMTATPIPRTIAQFLYADMDISSLKKSIYHDKQMFTYFHPTNSFFNIKNEIERLIDDGNLCYIVCSSIDENSKQQRSVTKLVEELQNYYVNRYTIGYIHSKVDDEKQEEIMRRFAAKEIQILVSTSIVEVGIDIQDANIMIIYDAQQFGLSQLHQLRGRVGRQARAGYCFLLSNHKDEDIVERLTFLQSTTNGYDISYYDFHRRGFGDLAGLRQSGKSFFSLINSDEDLQLIKDCYQDAVEYLDTAENDDHLLKKIANESILN